MPNQGVIFTCSSFPNCKLAAVALFAAAKILFVYSLYFYVDLSPPWGNSDLAFNGRAILGANQQ
ncbi:hypothetical protein AGROH133_09608 [Agrobacterium tumefaciens]|nr:hypothetical protein AGROH133_09608 [Agrobacterium tumefaciens]